METLNEHVNKNMVSRASLTNLFLSSLNEHVNKNVETMITRASCQDEEQRYGQDVSGQKEVETMSEFEKVETETEAVLVSEFEKVYRKLNRLANTTLTKTRDQIKYNSLCQRQ